MTVQPSQASAAVLAGRGEPGYYLRNARTHQVIDGPYAEHGSAQHEASRRNTAVTSLRLRLTHAPSADLVEVVLVPDPIWP